MSSAEKFENTRDLLGDLLGAKKSGCYRRPAAEAEGQRRWRGCAYARKNTGGEQGGGVRARVRRRALLGFETLEKPPTDMTGRTHAPM
jgi:hypothetical protein